MRIRRSRTGCEDREIIESYNNGLSLNKISVIFPISVSGVHKVLRMNGIKMRSHGIKGETNPRRRFTDEQEKLICNDYTSGKLMKDISIKYGTNPALISKALRRNGLVGRTSKSTGKVKEFSPRWRGGFTYYRGYKRIYVPDYKWAHKGGWIQEHRYIVQEHLGRKLEPWEVVHHKNGIRDDNRIENLEVMSAEDHNRLHAGKVIG